MGFFNFIGQAVSFPVKAVTNTLGGVAQGFNQVKQDGEKAIEQTDARKHSEVNYRNGTDTLRGTLDAVGGVIGAAGAWKFGAKYGQEAQTALSLALGNLTRKTGDLIVGIGEDYCAAKDYTREAQKRGLKVSKMKAFAENLTEVGTHIYDGAKGATISANEFDDTFVKDEIDV